MLNILRDRQTDRQTDRQSNYTLSAEIKKLLKKIPGLHKTVKLIRKPVQFYKNLSYARKHTFYNPESKIKFEKIPYIIHRDTDGVGLFSYLFTILGGIAFADKNNFAPVVDMKSYKNAYLYDDEVGHINAWEYYFEQPENISLEDALSSQKYIVGPDSVMHDWPSFNTSDFYYNRDGVLDYWRKYCRKYIKFKPEVLEKLKTLQEKTKGKKILGVSVRGTDVVAKKPHAHPIPPTPEQAIEKVQEVLSEKNFDAVYLATEDKNILKKFQDAFGEKLITFEQDYLDYDPNEWVTAQFTDRKNDRYLRGLEYLVSKLMLAKCQGFIASISSGSMGAMCLSEGFEYLYVFDLGVYD